MVGSGEAEGPKVFGVEGSFGLNDGGGEEVEVEELVPDEIVLLAPGAGLIEGEL
jgi:hypothetical protein